MAASAKGAAAGFVRGAALALMLEPSAPALPYFAPMAFGPDGRPGFGLLGHALESPGQRAGSAP